MLVAIQLSGPLKPYDVEGRITLGSGAEQRAVGVEAEACRAAVARAGASAKCRVERSLARRVGARRPAAARERAGGTTGLGRKFTRTLVNRLTIEVTDVEYGTAPAIGEVAAKGNVSRDFLTVTLVGDAVAAVEGLFRQSSSS